MAMRPSFCRAWSPDPANAGFTKPAPNGRRAWACLPYSGNGHSGMRASISDMRRMGGRPGGNRRSPFAEATGDELRRFHRWERPAGMRPAGGGPTYPPYKNGRRLGDPGYSLQ